MRLMGGLKKAMPISFALMIIMIITTSGLPPFAAFFSKGLILTSVTEFGGLIQAIILYATTAITFAYCIRMFSLVFMAPETEHIKKQHVHESPRVMMIPATILAAFCIIWGVSEPFVASFMGEHLIGGDAFGILYNAFFNLETPIFLTLLLPVGLLAYFSYYKGFQGVRKIASGKNPLSTTLKHAFFFDDAYNAFARGINGFSAALTRVENALFARIPDEGAAKVAQAAEPGHATTLKKGPSDSFRNYVAAAVVGFIIIIVLIVLTGGFGGA
jgi:NADH-quinone oxidoreductase subunit L